MSPAPGTDTFGWFGGFLRAEPAATTMSNGLARELREVKPAEPVVLPDRDVRARRPLLLASLLHFETLRRGARVAVLGVIDIAGLTLALVTALMLKYLVQFGYTGAEASVEQAVDVAPLACLVMVLLFARSGLYRDREQRPGFATVISSLFQLTAADAAVRGDRGLRVLVVLHLLRHAAVRAALRGRGPLGVRARQRLPAARRGLQPPGGAGGLGAQHRGGGHRAGRQLRDRAVRVRVAGLARSSSACATSARWTSSTRTSTTSTRC